MRASWAVVPGCTETFGLVLYVGSKMKFDSFALRQFCSRGIIAVLQFYKRESRLDPMPSPSPLTTAFITRHDLYRSHASMNKQKKKKTTLITMLALLITNFFHSDLEEKVRARKPRTREKSVVPRTPPTGVTKSARHKCVVFGVL